MPLMCETYFVDAYITAEGFLAHDKHIAAAIMFGRHHIEPGVLIAPAADVSVPAGDAEKLKEFVELIWPTVEQANARAPEYARIQKKVSFCPMYPYMRPHAEFAADRRGFAGKATGVHAERDAAPAGLPQDVCSRDRCSVQRRGGCSGGGEPPIP